MNVLTIHCGHSGSITISKDNELIVHTELERFSKFKYSDIVAFDLIKKINELDIFFNLIVIFFISHRIYLIYHYFRNKIKMIDVNLTLYFLLNYFFFL